MFTGIIEEIGEVVALKQVDDLLLWDGTVGSGTVLTVSCKRVLEGAYVGCSIAINGTCLTVTSFTFENGGAEEGSSAGQFEVNLSPETLRRTNLGTLRQGDGINLERAMQASARNSGHMVQGHVDGRGVVYSRRRDGDSLWMVIQASEDLMPYIVEKGYIAVDGTSLTVCDVDRTAHTFSYMLVPHTQANVVLPQRNVGSHVNLEVDVIAKYVHTGLSSFAGRLSQVEADVASLKQGTTPTSLPPGSAAVPAKDASPSSVSSSGVSHASDSKGEIKAINRQLRNKHGANLAVPLPTPEEASRLRIGIVRACWHDHLISKLQGKCVQTLLDHGVLKENIVEAVVPGSFELPYVAKQLASRDDIDAVVTIGILLKGGTIHMEVIATGVTGQILDVQRETNVPIVFGVLTVLSMEQAEERADSALGHSWGEAALCMAAHKIHGGVTKPLA